MVGVDFVAEAIDTAKRRALESGTSLRSLRFVEGDVTRLRQAGVPGPFDLITDTGCYHAIPADSRDAYSREVAAVAGPGADFLLAGVSDPPAIWRLLGARGIDADDLRRRFGNAFDLTEEQAAGASMRAPVAFRALSPCAPPLVRLLNAPTTRARVERAVQVSTVHISNGGPL